MLIKNKKTYYELQHKMLCGNNIVQYDSYEELNNSGYSGLVCIRDIKNGGRSGKSKMKYHMKIHEIPLKTRTDNDIVYIQSPDVTKINIQGEYSENGGLPTLWYSHVRAPMLVALKQESYIVVGLKARLIMHHYMDSDSYDDICNLIDQYTSISGVYTPTVEFTTYSTKMGKCNRNTLIWEIRHY